MALTPGDILDVSGTVTKEGAENLKIFADNLSQLFLVLQGTPDVIGDENLSLLYGEKYQAQRAAAGLLTGEELENYLNDFYERFAKLQESLAKSLSNGDISQENYDDFNKALQTTFLKN